MLLSNDHLLIKKKETPVEVLKVHSVVEILAEIIIRRQKFFFNFLFHTKQTNYLCFHDWLNKLTLKDNTISYCITLFTCVSDPATLLASNSVPGTLFSSENGLFVQLWANKDGWICIITSLILYVLHFLIWISSPELHGAPLTKILLEINNSV